MMPELLTSKDLAAMLSMGTRKAIEFCNDHGVQGINISPGGTYTILRWRRESVMKMLDDIEAKSKPAPVDIIPKYRSKITIQGKNADQVIEALSVPMQ